MGLVNLLAGQPGLRTMLAPAKHSEVDLYWLSVNWKFAFGVLACQGQGDSLLTL